MASLIQVANMALSAVGTKSTIAALNEQSPEANAINRWFDNVRDVALRSYPWSFARKTVALALVTNAPENIGPEYTYALPTDFIRVQRLPYDTLTVFNYDLGVVNPGTGDIRVLRTNLEDATMVYTARITNTQLWDPMFTQGVALLLGAACVPQLTGDVDLRNTLTQTGRAMLIEAMVADANESGIEVIDRVPDWIAARGDNYDLFFRALESEDHV